MVIWIILLKGNNVDYYQYINLPIIIIIIIIVVVVVINNNYYYYNIDLIYIYII